MLVCVSQPPRRVCLINLAKPNPKGVCSCTRLVKKPVRGFGFELTCLLVYWWGCWLAYLILGLFCLGCVCLVWKETTIRWCLFWFVTTATPKVVLGSWVLATKPQPEYGALDSNQPKRVAFVCARWTRNNPQEYLLSAIAAHPIRGVHLLPSPWHQQPKAVGCCCVVVRISHKVH